MKKKNTSLIVNIRSFQTNRKHFFFNPTERKQLSDNVQGYALQG